jgi:hypothetical protein
MINEKDENIISTVINIIKHPKEYEIVPTIEDTTSKTEVLTNKLSEVKQTILAWATLVCAIIAMSAMGTLFSSIGLFVFVFIIYIIFCYHCRSNGKIRLERTYYPISKYV